jgi:hypothetical protein
MHYLFFIIILCIIFIIIYIIIQSEKQLGDVLDDRGISSVLSKDREPSFSTAPVSDLRFTQTQMWTLGDLYQGRKWKRRDIERLLVSSGQAWSYTSSPSYVFIVLCL